MAKTNGTTNRDGRGRFVAGNRAAAGHGPPRHRAAVQKAVSERDLGDVLRAMVRVAKKGDVQAARLLLLYLVGKPRDTEENEPDDFEGQEMWEYL